MTCIILFHLGCKVRKNHYIKEFGAIVLSFDL